jgi:hypothetical protein
VSGPDREAAKASLAAILTSMLQDLDAARQLVVGLTDWDSNEQEQCAAEDLYDYVRTSRLSVQAALLLTKAEQKTEQNR